MCKVSYLNAECKQNIRKELNALKLNGRSLPTVSTQLPPLPSIKWPIRY